MINVLFVFAAYIISLAIFKARDAFFRYTRKCDNREEFDFVTQYLRQYAQPKCTQEDTECDIVPFSYGYDKYGVDCLIDNQNVLPSNTACRTT